MSKSKYATKSLRPRELYRESFLGWWLAIKLTCFPFLAALIVNLLLAFSSYYVKTAIEFYALKILATLIIFYCVMLAFFLIHTDWSGDKRGWKRQLVSYAKRLFPALIAFVIIFLGASILIAVGEVMSRLLLPYVHLLGKVAAPILISVIGLCAVIWVIACFYWPFFIIRDREKFVFAMRRSFSITGLAKTMMVYLPPVAFVLIFLLASPKLPWVNFPHSVWGDLAMEYLIKWIFGAWVLMITCIVMNESTFMLEKLEADIQEKRQRKRNKKAKKS
jgi:hypothetical protein